MSVGFGWFHCTTTRSAIAGLTVMKHFRHSTSLAVRTSIVLFAVLAWATMARAAIPPAPEEGQFLHDFAGVINPEERQTILGLQEEVFNKVGIPLIVVTVNRMHDYDPGAPSIETFASRWFNAWGIGSQQKNDGVLVIVSTGDRKGRIELGVAWGRRFDAYTQRVMDNDMVPAFKAGNYSGGLAAAVESLAVMAISGPNADPPEVSFGDRMRNNAVVKYTYHDNPVRNKLGTGMVIAMILAGLGCFVAAYFLPNHRKALVIAGVVLIALAVIFWIVIVIVVAQLRKGGSDGGGGGFGGGSSGGGGASGSW